jgi:hypothetical protein
VGEKDFSKYWSGRRDSRALLRKSRDLAHFVRSDFWSTNASDGGNPVIDKSEFVLSLFEQLDSKGLNAQAKSIIDRCTAAVYADWQEGGSLPTLIVLRDKLLAQPEPEAKGLAKRLGLNPKSLIKNIPNKSEPWKAPLNLWLHEIDDKRKAKSEQKRRRKEKANPDGSGVSGSKAD